MTDVGKESVFDGEPGVRATVRGGVSDETMERIARECPTGYSAPLLRLLDTARSKHAAAVADARSWERHFEMYARAWERELGSIGFVKRHRIDALVEATRRMRNEWFALKDAERRRNLNAALAARDECEAAWRAASLATDRRETAQVTASNTDESNNNDR